MHELLPLSWARTEGIRPAYRDITLPVSRLRWVTYADIPFDYSFQILHDDLSSTYPEGYVFRGCTPEMGDWFVSRNCSVIRTGAEAVLDLDGSHLEQKTVRASLARGENRGLSKRSRSTISIKQVSKSFKDIRYTSVNRSCVICSGQLLQGDVVVLFFARLPASGSPP